MHALACFFHHSPPTASRIIIDCSFNQGNDPAHVDVSSASDCTHTLLSLLVRDGEKTVHSRTLSWGIEGLLFDTYRIENSFAAIRDARLCTTMPMSGWPSEEHSVAVDTPFTVQDIWNWALKFHQTHPFSPRGTNKQHCTPYFLRFHVLHFL
jgi:hypothetical protein